MGFECPLRQTTADFLTSITSPAERIVREGFVGRTPFTPNEFAAAWHKSDDRARLLRNIDEFDQLYPIGGEQLEKFKESRRGKHPCLLMTHMVLTRQYSYSSEITVSPGCSRCSFKTLLIPSETYKISLYPLGFYASQTLYRPRLPALARGHESYADRLHWQCLHGSHYW